MRIEALAGDHFVFQHSVRDSNYPHEVVVLHRDAFEVEAWPKRGLCADVLEKLFEFRFRTDDDADDEDEDEDE